MSKVSGTFTTVGDERREVVGRVDGETLRLAVRDGGTRRLEEVPASEVGDVVKVVTRATWRGGAVIVADVDGDTVGFYSDDADLARREGLYGDQYSGWTGTTSLAELSEVQEQVTLLREGGRR